jgi:UDP-N-acetylglucosamine 2-epimerase (non-hydrolysing)
MPVVLSLFGTRPEVIKLAPVIRRMEELPDEFRTINVNSAQHTDLADPFIRLFDLRIDHDLRVMRPGQSPSEVCSRVLTAFDRTLGSTRPDIVLVQGDTSTALAGTLAAFHRRIPVGHVEAGLRTDNPQSPFPEEMNRRLISRMATFHFAATERNRRTLLAEGVPDASIFVTGNPVVDALGEILRRSGISPTVAELLRATEGCRRIVLTTHRRESLGPVMTGNLEVLRRFVDRGPDLVLIFPVHPNPEVVTAARNVLRGSPRVHLIEPLGYLEFIRLLSECWLIVSDSGGIQEEAPTLGKPVLILRDNTERPEAVEAGVARLVGGDPRRLAAMLEELDVDRTWVDGVREVQNPFGSGDSAPKIAKILGRLGSNRSRPDLRREVLNESTL